ncbi:hypothetical protein D3C79_36150 [compost metagenome]
MSITLNPILLKDWTIHFMSIQDKRVGVFLRGTIASPSWQAGVSIEFTTSGSFFDQQPMDIFYSNKHVAYQLSGAADRMDEIQEARSIMSHLRQLAPVHVLNYPCEDGFTIPEQALLSIPMPRAEPGSPVLEKTKINLHTLFSKSYINSLYLRDDEVDYSPLEGVATFRKSRIRMIVEEILPRLGDEETIFFVNMYTGGAFHVDKQNTLLTFPDNFTNEQIGRFGRAVFSDNSVLVLSPADYGNGKKIVGAYIAADSCNTVYRIGNDVVKHHFGKLIFN